MCDGLCSRACVWVPGRLWSSCLAWAAVAETTPSRRRRASLPTGAVAHCLHTRPLLLWSALQHGNGKERPRRDLERWWSGGRELIWGKISPICGCNRAIRYRVRGLRGLMGFEYGDKLFYCTQRGLQSGFTRAPVQRLNAIIYRSWKITKQSIHVNLSSQMWPGWKMREETL